MRVAYWKSERAPSLGMGGIERLDPAEFFDYDEWTHISEQAALDWHSCAAKLETQRRRLDGADVDLTPCVQQWAAIEYEQTRLFLALAQRWAEKLGADVEAGGCPIYGWRRQFSLPFPEYGHVVVSAAFTALDGLWLWLQPYLYGINELLKLLRAGSSPALPVQTVWLSVAPSEIAEADGQLDFAFLIRRGLLKPEQSLFLLNAEPSPAARARLARLGARWALESRAAAFLSLGQRLGAAWEIFKLLVEGLLPDGRAAHRVHLRLAAQAATWVRVGRALRAESLLNAISGCWPEPAATAAFNALGARTVLWFYGANVFGCSPTRPGFRNVTPVLSVLVSREVVVWSEAVSKDYFDKRLAPGLPRPTIRVAGPLMCGDARLLEDSPADARRKAGIESSTGARYVAVFDVMVLSDETRRYFGVGPTAYPRPMIESFYADILTALERLPELRLLLKTKRGLSDKRWQVPEGLRRLLDAEREPRKSGRILLLEHNVDPYLPVAAADLCLGIPFTSPVIAGLSAGRPCLYHDPTGATRHVALPELSPLITRGAEDLLARLGSWLRGGALVQSGPGLRPISHVAPAGDAGAAFARIIAEPHRSHTGG